jgi:ABC-type oligopeptide transport system substrate-binding subunit
MFARSVRNWLFNFVIIFFAMSFSVVWADSGKVLRIPLLDSFETMDPGLVQATNDGDVAGLVFTALTKFDKKFNVHPHGATSWEVSDDGLTYTFHLRKDLNWSTGEPVTAKDYVWALRRNLKPVTASPYVFIAYSLKNAQALFDKKITDPTQVGIKAVDDYTLQYTLNQAAAYFPATLTMPIFYALHRKTIEKYGPDWIKPENIVTSGLYRPVSWKRGNELVLKTNPDHPDKHMVNINEIRYMVIRSSATGLAMYKKGEVDLMGGEYLTIPNSELPEIQKDPVLSKEFSIVPRLCTYYYHFNTKRPPVDNKLVRQAIGLAIDRKMIVEKVMKGGQQPATTFTRPPIFGSVDPSEGIGLPFNPEKAQKLLAQAGYPNGKGFPEIELMHNTSESHAQVAQAIQYLLKKYLNIKVRISNQEFRVFLNSRKGVDAAHINRNGWCADYPDANNWLSQVFHPTASENETHWSNKEFGDLMDKAVASSDPSYRLACYKRAEEILTQEEAVMIPIYYYTNRTLVKPYLKNFSLMPMGWQFVNEWRLD